MITRFRNTAYARQMRTELQTVTLKDIHFGPTIPESVEVLTAMDRPAPDSYNTFRGKYGRMKGDVRKLADEIVAFLEARFWDSGAPKRVRD